MSKLRWGLATGLALACAAAAGIPTLAQPSRTTSHQMTPRAFKMNSPLSGSVLLARGLRSGLIKPIGASPTSAKRSRLPSSALPNVQASGGNGPSVANETPIATDPADGTHMISGANDYNCASFQGFYQSTNSGGLWTATCFPLEPSAVGGFGDPIVGYLVGKKSTIYAGGIDENGSGDGEIVVASWNDKTNTWNTPVVAASVSGTFMDKPWMEIDNGAGSKFRKSIYVSMTQFDDSTNGSRIGVSHSTDGGQTWTLVNVEKEQAYPDVDQFSDLAIDSNGTVYVSWMHCSATGPTFDCGGTIATMMVSKSTDGGNTWSKPVKADTVALVADSCACTFYGTLPNTLERVSNIPVIAVDNSATSTNGRLYITDTNYDRKSHVLRVQVVTSTDGGNTWSKPVRVSSKKEKAYNDQFFPWVNVSDNGLVGVTWMDRRNDPANVNYLEFGTTSPDGSSFATNTQLADTASDPWNDGFGGFFIGDYTGNSWTHGTIQNLMASWTDTRTGQDQDETGGLIP